LILYVTFSCSEPIDLNFAAEDSKMVVDGFITDSLKVHTIKLSFSSGFDLRGLPNPIWVTNAAINIEDETGVITNLTHTENGQYVTPMFAAVLGVGYKVNVVVNDKEYTSEFTYLPEEGMPYVDIDYRPAIRTINATNGVVAQAGVQIFSNIAKTDQTNYYQWIIEHWYVADATNILYDGGPNGNPPSGKFCYAKDFDFSVPKTVILEDRGTQSMDYKFDIDFIRINRKTLYEFYMVVTQLTLNAEAFQYWEAIKEQAANGGSLFDSAPFSIIGNVFSTSDKTPTLGYFGVHREKLGRLLIDAQQLPFLPPEVGCPGGPENNPCDDCINWPSASIQYNKPNWW
jgi:Domain of unknown function (DUF4249)